MQGIHFGIDTQGPIPEKELPKHDKIVDQKKWIETAKLPSGVCITLNDGRIGYVDLYDY